MQKHTIWLLGVILTTVIAFLAVFQPITFSPRKDPVDASRYLRPVGLTGEWNPTEAPSGTFSLGKSGTPVYVYTPQHDLALGLDLRGGMRVVLLMANEGEFKYTLSKPLETQDEVSTKQGELATLINEAFHGSKANPHVVMTVDKVTVSTTAADMTEANAQLKLVNAAMAKVFPESGAYTVPEAGTIYKKASKEAQDNVVGVMKKRIDPDGTREINAYAKGEDQIVIEIPGEKDPAHVRKMLGTTAKLRLMLLAQDVQVGEDKDGGVTLSRGGTTITHAEGLRSAMQVLDGRDLEPTSKVGYDQQGKPMIMFNVKTEHEKGETSPADRFGAVTGANMGRNLAIVLDEKIVSAPSIQGHITSEGQITGNFTPQEAKDLATVLKSGALLVKVDIVETRTVSATLGADSIAKSLTAGLIGLLAVLVFMIAYYRLPGIMANLALIIYIFVSLLVIKLFGVTLTLPGIAGVIISIGMAVDANVIIFERLKEELRAQKPLETAIDVAFSRAWTAILDSNVASLITGSVLYWLGSGVVQSFAVTLMIGVAVSLVTAVTITRLFMKLMIRSKAGHNLAWYGV